MDTCIECLHGRLILDRFDAYNASMNYSFQRKVSEYIERCHLQDGGYFFARILPSSGLDTYFAIKSLSILGLKPDHPESVVHFLLNDFKDSTLGSLPGNYLTVEILNELGFLTDDLRKSISPQIIAYENAVGGFGVYKDLNLDVISELQETYRAVKVLKTLHTPFDEQKVSQFIVQLLNTDGGYGSEGTSTLASTFFATEILSLLGVDNVKLAITEHYLRNKENNWQLHFIEDMYWLTKSFINLGEKPNYPDRIAKFVMECQRSNGGFSRATIMGIPNLEYTYYALSILSALGVINGV